ncbi:MAG: MBL fold metallo-hydrolase [Armatimonadetes bacterium]|nr:MBL fold metallo-hydrolase [Armatimonadota bacterium]
MLLTHAHIDHIGRLPLLARAGFRGPVFTTGSGVDLTRLLLLDSAHIQEEDARYKSKRHRREGRDKPETRPLYTIAEAQEALELLQGAEYHRPVHIAPGVTATFNDAGHLLGSASLRLTIERGGGRRTVVFSGDVGASPRPILRDPEPFDQADIALCESTYGNRLHETSEFASNTLADVINSAVERGGNVVIPSFAVGRTQTLLYYLRELMAAKRIPEVTTFVDSPMAVQATEILRKHRECYDDEARALIDAGKDPVGFEPLHYASSTDASKAINRIRGTALILSASGMCNAGRIKHHLLHNIGRSEATILFVGYQAQGTLGRQILDGQDPVRILGEMVPVRARIVNIEGLSGHADRDGLLAWLRPLGKPEQLYITHGEAEVADEFAGTVRAQLGLATTVPGYGDTVDL